MADLAGVTLSDDSRVLGEVFIWGLMVWRRGYEGEISVVRWEGRRARGHIIRCMRVLGGGLWSQSWTDPFPSEPSDAYGGISLLTLVSIILSSSIDYVLFISLLFPSSPHQ